MPNAYTLFGELKADTQSFKNSLRDADASLLQTKRNLEAVEAKSADLGKNTAVTGRAFDRLRENLDAARQRLALTSDAFQRGDATAGQMRAALLGVERASNAANSKLKDTTARLSDFSNKAADVRGKLEGIGSGLTSLGTTLTAAITAPLAGLGYAAIQSASNIDTLRVKLQAATGTVAAANEKFDELRTLAQQNVGVFTEGAVATFAFLKPMGLLDATIDEVIKSFGKLKAANPAIDLQKTAQNLTQLFTQNFERSDLKEMLGAFPRFGQIMQKAFRLAGSDLDSLSQGLKQLKTEGLTLEELFAKFAQEVNNDANLSKLTDPIAVRFEKMKERVMVALEPLGRAILTIFERIAPPITAMIEKVLAAFNTLSPTMQTIVGVLAAIATAAGPILVIAGGLITAISGITTAIATIGLPAIGIALAAIAGLVIQIGPVLAIVAAQLFVLYQAWQTNFGGIRQIVADVTAFLSEAWSRAMTAVQTLTQETLARVKEFWTQNGTEIMLAVEAVSQAIKTIWEGVKQFWAENGDAIMAVTSAVWEYVKNAVNIALNAILGLVKVFAGVINGDWKAVWDGTKQILMAVVAAWANIITGAQTILINAIKALVSSLFGLIYDSGKSLGENLVRGIIDGILALQNPVAYAIRRVMSGASSGVSGAASSGVIPTPPISSPAAPTLPNPVSSLLNNLSAPQSPVSAPASVSNANSRALGDSKSGTGQLQSYFQSVVDEIAGLRRDLKESGLNKLDVRVRNDSEESVKVGLSGPNQNDTADLYGFGGIVAFGGSAR